MGRGEFEEIIEECLSALLEGRRSVEESLSLYPAWRGRLEPLLRAAEEIAAGLDQVPPQHARERGLQRFLEASRARRRLRKMLPRQAKVTRWWRWAPAGLAGAIVIGALALTGANITAEDEQMSGGRATVALFTPGQERTVTSVPVRTSLERVQENVSVLEDAVREGEPVDVEFLRELKEASSELATDLAAPGEMGLIHRVAAVSAASREYELLQELQAQSSGAAALAVEETLQATVEVLEELGAAPTPTPTATPTPSPSPSPSASPSPSPPATPAQDGAETPSSTPSG